MRRVAIAGGLGGLVLLSALALSRGQSASPPANPAPAAKKEPPTLRTSGTATVRVKPDAARVFFGVQTTAPTIKAARADNNARGRKVMAALTALKIPGLKAKTSDIQVEILYGRHDGNQLPPIVGYRVSNTFTVLVENNDPARLGEWAGQVLDAALDGGANSVQRIAFLRKSGLAEARRKALTLAVEDAVANARALAAGAGKGRVEIVSVEDQPVQALPWLGNRMVQSVNVAVPAGGEGDAAMIVVGELEVTCRVTVACTF